MPKKQKVNAYFLFMQELVSYELNFKFISLFDIFSTENEET